MEFDYCYLFWQEINYDSPRGGVSVITEKGDVTTSYLLIQRAVAADSGKYTCSPSNANSKTVVVHVLNGRAKMTLCCWGEGLLRRIRGRRWWLTSPSTRCCGWTSLGVGCSWGEKECGGEIWCSRQRKYENRKGKVTI